MSFSNISLVDKLDNVASINIQISLHDFKKSLLQKYTSCLCECSPRLNSLIEMLNDIQDDRFDFSLEDFQIDPSSCKNKLFLTNEKKLGPTLFYFREKNRYSYELVKIHHLSGEKYQVMSFPVEEKLISSCVISSKCNKDVSQLIQMAMFEFESVKECVTINKNFPNLFPITVNTTTTSITAQLDVEKKMKARIFELQKLSNPFVNQQNKTSETRSYGDDEIFEELDSQELPESAEIEDNAYNDTMNNLLIPFAKDTLVTKDAYALRDDLNFIEEEGPVAIKNTCIPNLSKKLITYDDGDFDRCVILLNIKNGKGFIYLITCDYDSLVFDIKKYPVSDGMIRESDGFKERALKETINFVNEKLREFNKKKRDLKDIHCLELSPKKQKVTKNVQTNSLLKIKEKIDRIIEPFLMCIQFDPKVDDLIKKLDELSDQVEGRIELTETPLNFDPSKKIFCSGHAQSIHPIFIVGGDAKKGALDIIVFEDEAMKLYHEKFYISEGFLLCKKQASHVISEEQAQEIIATRI